MNQPGKGKMRGCCYSCKHWDRVRLKKVLVDVRRVNTDELLGIEFAGKSHVIPGWKYEIDESSKELVNGVREGSMGFCRGRLVRAWDEYDCFEPRLVKGETNLATGEKTDVAYLACWTQEACPFRDKCYSKGNPDYV